MSSVREQILAAVQTRLAAMSGVTVQARNTPEPARLIDGAKFVTLYDGEQSAPSMEETELGAWEYTMTPIVAGWVGTKSHAALAAAFDALHLQVVAVLHAAFADKLGVAGVRHVNIGDLEPEVADGEGTSPAMGFRQAVAIQYATPAGDPSTGLTT